MCGFQFPLTQEFANVLSSFCRWTAFELPSLVNSDR